MKFTFGKTLHRTAANLGERWPPKFTLLCFFFCLASIRVASVGFFKSSAKGKVKGWAKRRPKKRKTAEKLVETVVTVENGGEKQQQQNSTQHDSNDRERQRKKIIRRNWVKLSPAMTSEKVSGGVQLIFFSPASNVTLIAIVRVCGFLMKLMITFSNFFFTFWLFSWVPTVSETR